MKQPGLANFRMARTVNLRTTALVCGSLCLFISLPVLAQEAGLRGSVDEDLLKKESILKKKPAKKSRIAQVNTPVPQYRPVSDNGLPDDPLLDPQDTSPADQSVSTSGNGDDEPLITTGQSPKTASGTTIAGQNRSQRALDTDVPNPDRGTQGFGDEDPDSVASIDPDVVTRNERAARQNQREPAIEGVNRRAQEDPFAAPGIAAGSFTLRPTLNTGLRWTSNSDSSANGKAAVLSETSLRLRADSNWSRHKLGLEATGTWQKSISGAETNDPEAGLAADFEADMSEATKINGALGWNLSKESASAPAAVTGALTQPDLHRLSGSLGISHELGPIGLRLRTILERSAYGDATDALGATVSQEDRNNNFAGLVLRAGYEISPAITPFVEGEIGRRIYDNETDSFGLARSASRYAARVGVAADLGEKLRGDIAIGYLKEDIEDTALEDVSGLSLSGNIVWSPMRGTNVNFNASTTVEGSSTATSSGSLLHALSVAVNHKARDNLDLNANLGASFRDYASTSPNEVTLSAGAGFTYWFNRYTGLNGRAAHETVVSDDATREYQTNSVYLGITLRR
jgi:hypothetical protein